MALPKSGKSGSNVHDLDAVRRKRLKSFSADSPDVKSAKTKAPSLQGSAPADGNSGTKPARRKSDRNVETSNSATAAVTSEKNADGIKTPAKQSRVSNRRFDQEKVDRIKAELARDEYRIDYLQLADKFIEHERYS